MTIDYARAKREWPKSKGALTRAVNSGSLEKVVEACERFVETWDEIGCWPDEWSRWRRALDDAYWHAVRERDDLPDTLVARVHDLHDRGL